MKNNSKQKKSLQDWHPADIKAALAKRGFSLARIARENGYAETSPSNVFRVSWSAMEAIMANIIGVSPKNIWPSRYIKAKTISRLPRQKRGRND